MALISVCHIFLVQSFQFHPLSLLKLALNVFVVGIKFHYGDELLQLHLSLCCVCVCVSAP